MKISFKQRHFLNGINFYGLKRYEVCLFDIYNEFFIANSVNVNKRECIEAKMSADKNF